MHFYPEGSIEKYSTGLRPFKSGAFRLAAEQNVPIVPILITYRRPGKLARFFKKQPFINIEIGKPIYPSGDASESMCEKVRMLMEIT